MKTTMDAVNTLKGVWPSESIQIIEIDGVEFSEKEFNAQVKECSNNVGFPSVTAVDWSNAPEGATHFSCGLGHSSQWFYKAECGELLLCKEIHGAWELSCNTINFLNNNDDLIEKPQPTKPVYWDGKEELKVGMTVLVNGSKRVILLTADDDGDYVTMNDDGNYDFDSIHYIKPIDNRTPKEKAVNDLMDEQASLIGNIAYMKKSFGIAYDKWVK